MIASRTLSWFHIQGIVKDTMHWCCPGSGGSPPLQSKKRTPRQSEEFFRPWLRITLKITLLLSLTALIAVTVLINVARFMARMIVVFAGFFFLRLVTFRIRLVTVTVLIEVSWLVVRMIVVWAGLFLRHE